MATSPKTYSVEVRFDDGTTHTYDNVPENVTSDEVYARVQQEFERADVAELYRQPVVSEQPSVSGSPVSSQAPEGPSVSLSYEEAIDWANKNTPALAEDYAPNMYQNFQGVSVTLPKRDERLLLSMANNPDIPVEHLNRFLEENKKVPFTQEEMDQISSQREKIFSGEAAPYGSLEYRNPAREFLGDFTPIEDPSVGGTGAAIESGMANNPMGSLWRGVQDFLDIEQGGVSDEMIRQKYPGISEEGIELVRDLLMGELRRRELANAQYQLDVKDVGLGTRVAGELIGGASPVDLIPLGRGLTLGKRIVEGAAANAVIDAAMQAQDVAYGAQEEFSPEQLAMAIGTGAAIQGVFEIPGAISKAVKPASKVDAQTVETAPLIPVPTSRRNTKQYRLELEQAQDGVISQVSKISSEWTNSPEIEVHKTFKDVEGVDNTAVGVYTSRTLEDGTAVPVIKINTEAVLSTASKRKVSPEAVVEAVTFHEGLAHHGLASLFKNDLENFLDDIYVKGEAKFRDQVDHWLARNPAAYRELGETRRRIFATEEVLAEASEKGPLTLSKLDSFANYIKDFARTRLGLDLKYSQREIRAYLAVAHERTIKGTKTNYAPTTSRNMENNVIDFSVRRNETELKKFHARLLKEVREKSLKFSEIVSNLRKDGELPLEEGSRILTPKAKETGQGPWKITGYYVDTKNPLRYGYRVERGEEKSTLLVSDPVADSRLKERNPSWNRQEEVASWKVMTGPQRKPRYMRGDSGTPDEGDFERRMTNILEEVQEAYVPTVRSQEEARRAARLAGLRSTQYKNPRGLQDLDVRLFQYEAVNDRYQTKLLRLAERIDNPRDANDYVKASSVYKRVLYEYKLLIAKIQEDHAQIARALNAMKALDMTKRKINETLGLLDETFGNKTEAEAFAALDDPETFDALVKMMSAQIQAGNKLAAAKIAEKVGKPYWWQYALSFQHNSMLSGLGTHAVNAYDAVNILGRKLEERVVGGTIGSTRRALGAKETMSMMEGVGFTYGILRALVDAETYKNTYRAFKEGYEFQPFGAKIERQDARIPYLSVVNDLLYASDMFWRSFHMSANLYSLGVRKAFNEGLRGKELFEAGYANAINADKDLLDEAKLHADEALLVDKPSYLTGKIEAAKSIKPNMSFGAQTGSLIANLVFPFLRVSDRLVFQAIKRVPIAAFLDHNTRREWAMGGAARDAVLARQMMGGALLAYYWMMADPENADEEGYIEGYGPDDYKKRQALEATGYRSETVTEEDQVMRNANQINITANPFNTRNNLAVMVASIRQDWERSKKEEPDANRVASLLTAAMRSAGTFILEQGYADNVTPYVDAIRADPQQESRTANAVSDLAGRNIPALVRQLNQMYFDPVKRDTTGDKSAQDRIIGRLQSSLPGLSNLLPANIDALGEEQEHGRTLLRLGDGTRIKQGSPYTELRELERELPDPVLTEFDGSFEYEGENIKLNAFERNKWQAVQGQYLRDAMLEWVVSPEWQEMSTEEKADVVKDIRKEAYDSAKEQLIDEVLTARGL